MPRNLSNHRSHNLETTISKTMTTTIFGLLGLLAVLFGTTCAFSNGRRTTYFEETRIIGGSKAALKEFPFQASLQIDGAHSCGAVIIGPSELLTAGHCVEDDNLISPTGIHRVSIKAGAIDRSNTDKTLQIRNVSKIIRHESFKDTGFGCSNDIALIKLSSPLKFNANVKAIKMPPPDKKSVDPTAGTPLSISGWGTTNESQGKAGFSKQLLKATVYVIPLDKCKRALPESPVTETVLCAGVEDGSKDACHGDSGGPLVSADRKTLIGIVSFGKGCGRKGIPGVYSKITSFRKWIKTNSGI